MMMIFIWYWLILTEVGQLQEKNSPKKIVKKNEFIGCHQESVYTGHFQRLMMFS
jgi:hypothetical protein